MQICRSWHHSLYIKFVKLCSNVSCTTRVNYNTLLSFIVKFNGESTIITVHHKYLIKSNQNEYKIERKLLHFHKKNNFHRYQTEILLFDIIWGKLHLTTDHKLIEKCFTVIGYIQVSILVFIFLSSLPFGPQKKTTEHSDTEKYKNLLELYSKRN